MTNNTLNKRLVSIDILRGLVIVIMLIDHARERFFLHHQVADPMDIQSTDPTLFFTRLLAHFCAPIFIFLTGLSAFLYQNPLNQPQRAVQSFLLKRGALLILLEMTIINFSWFAAYNTLYLQVMWAIGVSMISLAVLSYLPRIWLIGLGIAIVFGHNALSPVTFLPDEMGYTLWTILHDRGYLLTDGFIKIKASYPVLPWIGVIVLGYVSGPLFTKSVDVATRQKTLIAGGIACLICLCILRSLNVYGEAIDWQIQDTLVMSVMSFLNYTKYPPSLPFLLFTLGVGALLLAYLENAQSKVSEVLRTFGSVPLFFYIVHLYVLLLSYFVLFQIFGPTLHFGANNTPYLAFPNIELIWLTAAVLTGLLYKPCKAFAKFKHRSELRWVKYL
ncbi:DUF1624 domain-containing protein [Pseudoalteromonas sp. MMG012]|uniref:DUF1624 domain-containing protein n=1 Tax=Pseudoalteromonas sp. MMG012 TaxID=2822686 RepID=UPI001B39D41D|nr:heparan-alpha-glucosaminide N-acetyltransferase domain-containing protein [Pseudoalteromonas sp. MMG012]MBQ4849311.1 DUF1624 domain-containing protein [Pseudoalteromonas sp. MMG012]